MKFNFGTYTQSGGGTSALRIDIGKNFKVPKVSYKEKIYLGVADSGALKKRNRKIRETLIELNIRGKHLDGKAVNKLYIIQGGSGYTAGNFTIGNAGTKGTGLTSNGFTVTGGVITGITLTTAGSGYVLPPTLTNASGSGALIYTQFDNFGCLVEALKQIVNDNGKTITLEPDTTTDLESNVNLGNGFGQNINVDLLDLILEPEQTEIPSFNLKLKLRKVI